MKKYDSSVPFQADPKLLALLKKRKGILTNEATQKVREELTVYMTNDLWFLVAVFPAESARKEDFLTALDIERADMMQDVENQYYLPVFTDEESLLAFKPELKEGEAIYLCDKKDMLEFLGFNEHVAAIVVNPMKDDLLLYRAILQNLLKVAADRL